MIIDAHQHFWTLTRGDYTFPAPGDPVLYRDFTPADLAPILQAAGVARTVAVQATDTLAETAFLLNIAEHTPFVAGVVGWWDPRGPDDLDGLLALRGHAHLVGVRPMLQRFDDIGWLVQADALSGLARLAGHRLAFDALVDTRHLSVIAELCAALPDLHVVVDHMGKPWRHPDRFADWTSGMQRIAEARNAWVKVSGFPFPSNGGTQHADLACLIDFLRGAFGASRLVWGSDWPVVQREGGYTVALDTMKRHFPPHELTGVFGGNAAALYRLGAS